LSDTKLHPRHLEWDGLINARDTGGMPTPDGATNEGALVRSDLLNGLTPDGVAALIAHGVRTVIDVRTADEIAEDWERYPIKGDGPVGYLNKPFRAELDAARLDELRTIYRTAQTREQFNRADLDYHGEGIADIVGAIADAPPGGVLVHCYAGKDRTGIVIALALSAVGVSDADIADDYALTQLVLEPLIADWLDRMTSDPAERARLRELSIPTREAMLDTLTYLHERYGGAAPYLRANGVTQRQIDALRARLVARA
jgi:protein-tyrosine phosphatase